MNILVLNCGSSSLKFQIIDTDVEHIKNNSDKVLAKGLFEKIGTNEAIISFKADGDGSTNIFTEVAPVSDHVEAIRKIIDWLMLDTTHIEGINKLSDIAAVGHRTVHGSETFNSSMLISDAVIKELEKNIDLAPLHNPANIKGINAATEIFGKDMPQVGVFDTAFHATMPEHAFLYGIPYEYYQNYKVRKYGFHGTSHRFMGIRYRALTGKSVADTNIISLHLGNGASMTAIKNGKSIDTSMGFTPLEGLIMGTRSGDIDPTILEYIMNKENKSISETISIVNKQSGVFGISGISNDMRDIEKANTDGNPKAKLATEMYCYRIKKYIGSYLAAMNGADAICFTAGIGENDTKIRDHVCEGLEYAGLLFDKDANRDYERGTEAIISKPDSKIKVFVIPTNEELMIARDTYCIVSSTPLMD